MLTIDPLHPLFAAEVINLDLSVKADAETLAQIDDAFLKFSVICVSQPRRHQRALTQTSARTNHHRASGIG